MSVKTVEEILFRVGDPYTDRDGRESVRYKGYDTQYLAQLVPPPAVFHGMKEVQSYLRRWDEAIDRLGPAKRQSRL